MAWLFGQTWFWLLIAFLVGVLVAWVVARLMYPLKKDAFDDVDDAEIIEGGRS